MHNKLSKLHDELLSAISALRPVQADPIVLIDGVAMKNPVMYVEGVSGEASDCWVRLVVPDDADESAIQAVIDAHSYD
tara:strand:+ start:128 stop:361 length:234 start_codon:yes stop_codon:yes gene_type:complete